MDTNTNFEDKFRMSRKQFFLTYAQTNETLSKEEALDLLKNKCLVQKYLLIEEPHSKEGKHIHCYLDCQKKLDIRSSRFFDLEKNGEVFHPNIQPVGKKREFFWKYFFKFDVETLTNMTDIELYKKTEQEKSTEIFTELRLLAEREGVDVAMNYFYETHPNRIEKYYSKYLHTLSECIEKRNNYLASTQEPKGYSLESFGLTKDRQIIEDWLTNQSHEKTLVLIGKSGWGKTEFIKAVLRPFNPLLINNTEALKLFRPGYHKAIIMDDMSWSRLNVKEQIHLLDVKNSSVQPIKYGSIQLPAGLIKVVTCNAKKEVVNAVGGYSSENETAPILRRCLFHELKEPLYKTKEEKHKDIEIPEWRTENPVPIFLAALEPLRRVKSWVKTVRPSNSANFGWKYKMPHVWDRLLLDFLENKETSLRYFVFRRFQVRYNQYAHFITNCIAGEIEYRVEIGEPEKSKLRKARETSLKELEKRIEVFEKDLRRFSEFCQPSREATNVEAELVELRELILRNFEGWYISDEEIAESNARIEELKKEGLL